MESKREVLAQRDQAIGKHRFRRATDEKNFQLADAPAASRNVARVRRQHDTAPFFAVAPKKETEINYFWRQRQIRSWRNDRSSAWYD